MFGTLALRAFYVAFNSSSGRVGFSRVYDQVGEEMEMEIRNRWMRIVWVHGDACRVRATSKRRIRAKSRTAMRITS